MTQAATDTRSVVVERDIAYPPEKIWRALTQPHLIEVWLMKNDFAPIVDHAFTLKGDWGAVDCRVLRGGSVCLNSPARLLSGASAGFTPLREAVG